MFDDDIKNVKLAIDSGHSAFQVTNSVQLIDVLNFLKKINEYVAASDFINVREITAKFDQLMKNCEYVIIPCCYDLRADVEFLIRIFTEIL